MYRYLAHCLTASGLFAAGYTTYIGDAYKYNVTAMTSDAAGNTYITGGRQIAVPGPNQAELDDVFVTKLDPAGTQVFTATLSGKGSERANAIAVDSSGGIFVAGSTSSPDFPQTGALQFLPSGYGTGFLTKFSADGRKILFSTYFGGTTGPTAVNALATDGNGNVYLTGYTYAGDFPQTSKLPNARVVFMGVPMVSGAFVAEISGAGDKLVYSGLIAGGSVSCGAGSSCFLSARNTQGIGIAVDQAGNAYVAGNTNTTDLPTTSGALRPQGIGAFVAKVNAGGTGVAYLTYLGSTNYVLAPFANPANVLHGIAVDTAGNAYLAGATSDPNFPATSGVVQPAFGGGTPLDPSQAPPTDAFAAKLNPNGSSMVWATFLGGTNADSAAAIAIDNGGNAWIGGTTASAEFPNVNGWSQGSDFLVGLNASAAEIVYSGRYPAGTVSTAVSIDPLGVAHAAGNTGLVAAVVPSQPVTSMIAGISNIAGGAFAGRIALAELIAIHGPRLGPATPVSANFDSAGMLPLSLGGVQVSIGGKAAPLLFVSDQQINAIVPMGAAQGAADIVVTSGENLVPAFRSSVVAADPQIFTTADGSAAALNQDGSLNSPANPARPGAIVSIWATGTGSSFYPLADGHVASAPNPVCYSCSMDWNGQAAPILYAGAAPGLVAGVVQINFQLPMDTAANGSFTLGAGGARSLPVLIYVAPPAQP